MPGRSGSGIAIALNVGNEGIRNTIRRMESEIKTALISLLDAIKRSDGTVVARDMAMLDDLLARAQTNGGLHPQLEHFLGNRSYAKALMFLGGDSAVGASNPPGGCATRQAKPAKG